MIFDQEKSKENDHIKEFQRTVMMHQFMEICSSKAGLFQSDLKSIWEMKGNRKSKGQFSILVFDTFSKLIFITQKPTSLQRT